MPNAFASAADRSSAAGDAIAANLPGCKEVRRDYGNAKHSDFDEKQNMCWVSKELAVNHIQNFYADFIMARWKLHPVIAVNERS
jgi:hypothetical protein